MKARYVEELVDIVGDAKYGIVFSTKGPRSAASEIANGDFDGDMYWVSINRKVGFQFWFVKSYFLERRESTCICFMTGIGCFPRIYDCLFYKNTVVQHLIFEFQLVDSYRASKPWTRTHSTPKAVSKKPTEFSADELEYELFRQFLGAKSKGYAY